MTGAFAAGRGQVEKGGGVVVQDGSAPLGAEVEAEDGLDGGQVGIGEFREFAPEQDPIPEVAQALDRLGREGVHRLEDGWENKDTADIWVEGPHAIIANITVPAILLSMLTMLVLLLTVAVQERRRSAV